MACHDSAERLIRMLSQLAMGKLPIRYTANRIECLPRSPSIANKIKNRSDAVHAPADDWH